MLRTLVRSQAILVDGDPGQPPAIDRMQGPYDAARVETHWYGRWEESGHFAPSDDPSGEPFVIAMPPPNITGALHNGHVMFVAYQDLMIRWYRMRGRAALWVPGTDHAAIATQAVIERDLRREGTSRHEIGREGFERRFWQWRDTYGSRITQQLRRLGASADWTRERFTMDDQLSHAVREAFVRLYEKGLIYRGEYLVNWCPEDRSAISDLEVEHETVNGQLWHIRYPLKDGGHLIVATTRPETMLGDTAVAVHPDEERYRDVVGRVAMVPGLGREIPVIADPEVDREFGTGAVKITPGHDPNDWRMGQRHQLPVISILNDDGSLNDEAGQWAGLDRFEARGAYVAYLETEGLLDRVEPHTHALGHCQRDGSVVEPRVSLQWFVNARPLADRAAQAARDGTLTFHPRRAADEFRRWMEMIQPWCISRQLWLGHRIPVWYCGACGETLVTRTDPVRCSECGSHDLAQDPDVLDTWFSSGLWPFSTLGWPDATPDFERFYPTDVLETGIDIIFFWVARMVMLGLELTDRLPFHTVYFNGMVRHADGSKIEKSNYQPGDDPAEVIEPYGADAFRFMMVTSTSEGADLRINLKRIEASAHFANKVWNGAKFVIGAMQRTDATADMAAPTIVDEWITARLGALHADVVRLVESYQFGEAGRRLHDFLWSEFFDWYVEAAKIRLYADTPDDARRAAATLAHVLDGSLRLLHPFMPSLTEEIWHHFRGAGGAPDAPEWLIVTPIGEPPPPGNDEAVRQVRDLIAIVQGIRNARHESNVEPGRMIEARIVLNGEAAFIERERAFVERLARVQPLSFHPQGTQFDDPAVTVRAAEVEVCLPVAGMIDLAVEHERLARERAARLADLERAEALLANAAFRERAPSAVVDNERQKAAAARTAVAQIDDRLRALPPQSQTPRS